MPTSTNVDNERERVKDRDREDKERGNSKSQQKASSSSKSKDLSHVPCKFFKVGSCTAGSSCPFSHSVLEPGGQKDVCAWFVKGNCKFGHKCALAHVLPGQSMSMDRKNKKAAQVAANGGKNDSKSGSGRGGKRDSQTARPPITMSLKSSISAPAAAIKDTDFTSLDALDEVTKLPIAPAHGKQPSTSQNTADAEASLKNATSSPTAHEDNLDSPSTPVKPPSPSLPVSSPRRSERSPARPDFGPIGSPPRSANAISHPISRLNGANAGSFSPGTSPTSRNINGTPNNNFLSTSPFSAPGTQTVFLNYNERSGMPASLGSGLVMGGGASRTKAGWGTSGQDSDARRGSALDDGGDDMEDFLPSSLTDLLTPEERSRRMSRSNSGQGAAVQGENNPLLSPSKKSPLGVPLAAGSNPSGSGSGNGHRYSRSVPAPSLLGDVSSIWSNQNGGGNGGLTPNVGSPLAGGLPSSPGRVLGNGTPGSFGQASSSFGGRAAFDPLGEDFAGSPSAFNLTPSNASAAFLPGVHTQYLKAKQQAGLGSVASSVLGRGVRNISSPLYPSNSGAGTLQNSLAAATSRLTGGSGYGTPTGTNGFSDLGLGGQNGDQLHRPNLLSSNSASQTNAIRQIPAAHFSGANDDPQMALSPGSRALQAHAPGQSLPQGLAAGYSRIHALPPPLPLASPGSTGIGGGGYSISPGVANAFNAGPYGSNTAFGRENNIRDGEWAGGFGGLYGGANTGMTGGPPGLAHPVQSQGHLNPHAGGAGGESIDTSGSSKLSYSAAAAKGGPTGNVLLPQKSKWAQQGVASSPLSKPVAGGDDDDLFTLDA